MNQAQALSSVNYRILRTISLNKHFYIIDIAYSDRGTVCLSVVKQVFITSATRLWKDVKIVLPTGSYIQYGQNKFYYLEDNILKYCFTSDSCVKKNDSILIHQYKANEKFQTHGIAICK